MEMECVTEFPHTHMDRRPRKRPRFAWDAPQLHPKSGISATKCSKTIFWAQPGIYCGQEVGNVTSHGTSRVLSDQASIFVKGLAQKGSPPWRDDDKDGHFMFALGENLTSRYKIHRKIGEGTFGQVLECWDRETRRCCGQIRNWFDYRNHICIVFEMLGPSLYDFLRKNNYRSFPVDLVREIGNNFMHDLHLIHTDLKPENILFVSPEYVKVSDYKVTTRSPKDGICYKKLPRSSAIKVIDFGSTAFECQDHSYIVSTRHYRAPEVILGLGWSYPCDMWSVGCILVELCSGEALFQTHENLEHLAMMERVLGPIPPHMLKRVDRHAEKYVRKGRLDWPEGAISRESIKAVMKLPRLPNLVMQHVDHSAGDLIDLLQGLLRYDPSNRLTPQDALRHPFFTRDYHSRF
ncbi:Serine/threonine-protein kinase AFC2 [Vitis vinifera]|uniref:dual-specificity kinase n=1 Tax=Vitis vinifera TaxID=29760 RepID=A0A438J5S5_VITVI|nr:Serine/threonine-protein kinase AFC2 [Vitis vinifera]